MTKIKGLFWGYGIILVIMWILFLCCPGSVLTIMFRLLWIELLISWVLWIMFTLDSKWYQWKGFVFIVSILQILLWILLFIPSRQIGIIEVAMIILWILLIIKGILMTFQWLTPEWNKLWMVLWILGILFGLLIIACPFLYPLLIMYITWIILIIVWVAMVYFWFSVKEVEVVEGKVVKIESTNWTVEIPPIEWNQNNENSENTTGQTEEQKQDNTTTETEEQNQEKPEETNSENNTPENVQNWNL